MPGTDQNRNLRCQVFEIEKLYDLVSLKLTSREKLAEFLTAFLESGEDNLEVVATFPAVNTLRDYPEWLKSIFTLPLTPEARRVLLRACVILLHEKSVSPSVVVEALKFYGTISSEVEARLLQKIVLKVDDSNVDTKVTLYRILFTQGNYRLKVLLLPGMLDFLVRHISHFDHDFLRELARYVNDNDYFNTDIFNCLKNCDRETVLDFLCHFIPASVGKQTCWRSLCSFLRLFFDDSVPLLVRRFAERGIMLAEHSIYEQFWNYLTGLSEDINITENDLESISDLIPFLSRDRFLRLAAKCNPGAHSSTFLLNNIAVVEDKRRFVTLLKTYLNSHKSLNKFVTPLIPVDRDILKQLSLRQIVYLTLLSFVSRGKTARFTYTPDAIAEMKKKLTVAITAGMCESSVLELFP